MGHPKVNEGLLWWLNGKEPTCQCERYGFDPWDREIPQEKEMAIHSSIHAWKIPWTQEPGRGLEKVGHDITKQQQQKSMNYNWPFSHQLQGHSNL